MTVNLGHARRENISGAPDDVKVFEEERRQRVLDYAENAEFGALSRNWLERSMAEKYVHNFDWAGLPIIQYPHDVVAFQELVWRTRPDLIIETGVARGGSLMLSASLLAMLDYCDAVESGASFDPRASRRAVLGIDIDIRANNRRAIEGHPFSHMIKLIEGSSVDEETISAVRNFARPFKRVQVCLDSSHTHDHVLAELEAYAPLVTPGCYCITFDTFIEDMPKGFFVDRPWDVGNSPKTAVIEFLKRLREEGRIASDGDCLAFEVDRLMELKLSVTAAPQGYLRRTE